MELSIAKGIEWIFTHIWNALREIGGVAIVTAICTFISHRMNVKYEKRITQKYDAELEVLKNDLATRNHISKTRLICTQKTGHRSFSKRNS